MKTKFLLIIIMTFSLTAQSQSWTWHWGNKIGSSEEEETPRVAVDNDNNVFVTGTYKAAISLGDDTHAAPESGSRDIILVKYDEDGNLLWSTSFSGGGPGNIQHGADLVKDIVTDDNGNVYLVGNLGPNALTAGEELGNGDDRNFVAQVTADGDLGWILTAGDNYLNDRLFTIDVGLNGNIYVSGYRGQENNGYTFGGVTGTGMENSSALIEISPEGDVLWVGGINAKEVRRMAFDQDGHIILSSFSDSGGPGNAGHYLTKIDLETKEEIWVRYAYSNTQGAGRSELGLHVKEDGSIVQFMTVGTSSVLEYEDGVNSPGDNANRVGLIYHIASDGVATSVHPMADHLIDAYLNLEFADFLGLDDDTFYLVGFITEPVEMTAGGMLNPDPGFIASIPQRDVLVLKVDGTGSIQEVALQTGSGPQKGVDAELMTNGDVVVCGRFDTPSHPFFGVGNTIFGPDELVEEGNEDIFVTRVTTGVNGTDGIEEVNEMHNFKVYPNPASEAVNLAFDNPSGGEVRMELVDINGRMVFSAKEGNSPIVRTQISTQDVSPGIYIIRAFVGEFILAKPLVVN